MEKQIVNLRFIERNCEKFLLVVAKSDIMIMIGGKVMSQVKSINIRVDSVLKEKSDIVLADIGISTSTVISMLLRTIVRNKAIPPELFTIDSKTNDNATYIAKLDRSFAEYKSGMGKVHTLLEVPND